MRYFLFRKTCSAYLKPANTYFQTFEKLTSRLAPASESGVSSLPGPIFLNEKKSTIQKNVCKLVERKWVKIQRFWLILKIGLNTKYIDKAWFITLKSNSADILPPSHESDVMVLFPFCFHKILNSMRKHLKIRWLNVGQISKHFLSEIDVLII